MTGEDEYDPELDREEEEEEARRRRRRRRRNSGSFDATVRGVMDLYLDATDRDSGVSPQVTDAITQALVAVLGSGPSVAVLDSLISANQANAVMYHNSVAHQQKTNILGMVATMNCVARLLDMPSGTIMSELDHESDYPG